MFLTDAAPARAKGRCLLEKPLLVPLASLLAGLVAAHLFGAVPPAWSLPALLVTTLTACFLRSRLPFLFSISLFFAVWGGRSLEPFLHPGDGPARFAGEAPVLVEGVVSHRPEAVATGGARVLLEVAAISNQERREPVRGRLLVYVKQGRVELATGDRILFSSRIRRPRPYGLPGELDQAKRLAYRGVFATASVPHPEDLVLLREGGGWRHAADRVAAMLGTFIMKAEPGREGGVLKALLIGDRGDVPEELQDAWARGGVNHILSISGFHVGIVFLSLFHALYLLARGSETLALRMNLRQALPLAALPVVLCYLVLSGESPATLRSVLMIAAVVVALHLKREVDPVQSVLVAACAILCAAPELLFEVSLQLSFLAIWGLVVLAPVLAGICPDTGTVRRWLLLLVAASAAAVLATLVPVAYYFQRVPLVGMVANLAVIPLVGYGAVVLGFVSLLLANPAPPVAEALLHAAAVLVRSADRAVVYLARAPTLDSYAPDRVDLLLSFLVLGALTFVAGALLRRAAVSVLVLLLLVRAAPDDAAEKGRLVVDFLSVGQGDAALVHLPEGKWMLVDGGGNAGGGAATVGSRLLLPALRQLGVKRLDYLVLSHEHPDHLQGLLDVAAKTEVGEFWETGIAAHSHDYLKLKWILHSRGIPVRLVNASVAPFMVGGALVQPLWPLERRDVPGEANEDSLVFRLVHGKGSLLFTGDLGIRGERELLDRGSVSPCSILKVAHHGSRYSSSDPFLAAVRPAAAVISAGYGNTFHLPAGSTLTRLQRHRIRVYRTDTDGTVRAVIGADGGAALTTPWGAF